MGADAVHAGGPSALVLDTQLRSSLAGLRGLGRAGIDAIALGDRRAAAGSWSRYATERTVAPAGDAAARGRLVADLAERRGGLIAFPGSEHGVDTVVAAAGQSPAVVPPFALEALHTLRHKHRLAALAAAEGVATPATLVETTVAALRAAPPELPCAVKPLRQDGPVRTTRIVESPGELARLLDRLGDERKLLVQPVVPGRLVSLGLVLDRSGGVLAAFQQIALRTWPVQAGSSAVGVSVALDHDLLERAVLVLRAAGYWGLADVEFLQAEGGGATLIDVNPRYYGNLAPAATVGVNLPAAWHAAVLGTAEAPAVPPPYRAGVSYRWVEADAVAALRGRPRRLLERAPRPVVGAMWAPDDPLPAVLMAGAGLAQRVRGVVRRPVPAES